MGLAEGVGFGLCYFLYDTRNLGRAWFSCILQIMTHRNTFRVGGCGDTKPPIPNEDRCAAKETGMNPSLPSDTSGKERADFRKDLAMTASHCQLKPKQRTLDRTAEKESFVAEADVNSANAWQFQLHRRTSDPRRQPRALALMALALMGVPASGRSILCTGAGRSGRRNPLKCSVTHHPANVIPC